MWSSVSRSDAHVDRVAEPGRDPQGTTLAAAPDDHRQRADRSRVGRGLGQARRALPVVRLGAGGPQRPHRLDRRLEQVEPLPVGRERQPEAGVLALPPAGADADERATAAQHVEGRRRLGDDARRAGRSPACTSVPSRSPVSSAGEQARASPRAPGSAPRPGRPAGSGSRWSISASPAKPGLVRGPSDLAEPAGRVLAPREAARPGARPRPLRTYADRSPPRAAGPSTRGPGGAREALGATTSWTTSQPSSASSVAESRTARSWAARTGAGTGTVAGGVAPPALRVRGGQQRRRPRGARPRGPAASQPRAAFGIEAEGVDDRAQPTTQPGGDDRGPAARTRRSRRRGRAARCPPRRAARRTTRSRRGGSAPRPTSTCPTRTRRRGRRRAGSGSR